MPHMWIESSANITSEPEVASLKHKVYQAALATGIFPVAGIRVRHTVIDDYIVGDDHPDNAFVHVVVRLGIGRDEDTKRKAAESMFSEIEKHLLALSERKPLAVAFEIQEMHPELNFKFNNLREHIAKRQNAA
ncbi:hypothetical protein AB4072_13550 [Microvirga sp. 2MCAF38]|uniref:hypothetical protein n=1 Tax=Microvirga sp. 2MCAF38 TaxID=3232989 RepID=UPI003F9D95D9